MTKNCHPLIKPFIPVVRFLGEMLDNNYEIALHDISGDAPVLVEYAHGEITGRTDDSPMTEFGNFLIDNPNVENVDYFANYPSEASSGRKLRSGVSLIRDENKRLIGFLCINYDVTRASILKDFGDFLTHTKHLSLDGVKKERFYNLPDADALLKSARRKFGKPLNFMNCDERKQCIKYLDEEGFFNFKGAVEGLAKEMEKSRYTLYADLRAARGGK